MNEQKKKIIDALNAGISMELTAVHQYMYNAVILRDWGIDKLAEFESKEAREESKHADKFGDRVLFLGGEPDFQKIGTLKKANSVQDLLENNLMMEEAAMAKYSEFIKICTDAEDFSTRSLFLDVLKEEEGHAGHLGKQLNLIKLMGIENYLLSVSS